MYSIGLVLVFHWPGAGVVKTHMRQASACLTAQQKGLYAVLQRLRGREVTMITGTDELGEKIVLSASKAGLEPKAHCDAVVQEYKDLWQLVRHEPAC